MRQRVLHIHTLPVVSGSGLNTLATIRLLRAHGFESALACAPTDPDAGAGPSLADHARDLGIAVHTIPHLTRALSARKDALALGEIVAAIRRGGFEVVHTHNSKAGLLGRLAACIAGAPAIVHTVHGWAFEQSPSPTARLLYRFIERRAAPLAHRTILVSEALEASAREAGLPRRLRRRVIHSGIDRQAFLSARREDSLRAALGATKGSFLLGQVSKLWEGKGHETLLEAFDRLRRVHPESQLVLIGDGPLRTSIESTARRLGLADRTLFLGHRNDVPALTAQLDAATLCSAYEGMGRVVVEAMAAGVPVIASRVGGIPELVREGRNGYLVPPGNASALAGRLGQLAGDGALRRRMSREARASVGERFDEGTMAAEIASVYRAALAGYGLREPAVPHEGILLGQRSCT
ncbi:MAG: glycosyltransferase family 4 protein [Deltaproteobacteria bacterium]|nr:glycosyltransferase family 4 protein [Deltaproteobacteria bacterium]